MSENLASKYRPKSFSDVVEQSVVVDIVKNICESNNISNRNFLFIGSAGCGKAAPLDSLVLTPSGYIEMGDVTAGTEVYTRYGDIAEVTDIFPQGKRQIYKITLSDGSAIRVADNHLNVVYQIVDGKKREYVLDTEELISRCIDSPTSTKFYIDSVVIDSYEGSYDFKMNPYLGGFLCSSAVIDAFGITIGVRNNIDLNEIKYILQSDYNLDLKPAAKAESLTKAERDTKIDYYWISGPADSDGSGYAKDYILFKNHLEEYMTVKFDSRRKFQHDLQLLKLDARREFIRGFLDGLSSKDHFSTTSLIDSHIISNVMRSSGYVDNVKKYSPEDGRTHYVHDIRLSYSAHGSGAKREIVSITADGIEECQCIYVDNPDHTYIMDYMTPTHNTTLCRIIANELNEGKGQPIEIDAASHNGTEAVREIIDQARSYPVGCNWKVFILDEAHSFSPQSWQIWLKTLEEQPARSLFMFATTNPEKIPATILSRVQTFQLSKISLDGIYARLKYIIEQENAEGRNIIADDDAIRYISRLSQGGMRDAITLLDKSLAYSNEITLDTITKSLGLPNYDRYFDLLNAIAKKDNGSIVTIINDVYNSGLNFVKWFEGFFGFVTNIVKYIYLKDINQTMIPSTYQDKIQNYGPAHSAICLRLSSTLTKMNQELKTSQYLQEIAISYLCTPPQLKQ